MELILIGTKDAKRTVYFERAASELNTPFTFVDWDRLEQELPFFSHGEYVIKIDPPAYQTCKLSDMQQELDKYQKCLHQLQSTGCAFLNTPESILTLLNKSLCKTCLQNAGIPTTQMLAGEFKNTENLISSMYENKVYAVFIKPVFFSGAAGVVALRIHPRSNKMTAYTSCRLEQGILINTKRLFKLESEQEIRTLLAALLSVDVMVERWHPKESFQGKSYDLRVVYQFGHIAFVVARQSSGPVTNLHLNNQALDVTTLGLTPEKFQEIEGLCMEAVNLFPGLSMAGIDILIEKNTGRLLIIEMNGQGDLVYRDIYGENRIYREQIMQLGENGT